MGLRLLALSCLVGAAFAGPFQRETGSRCSTRCPINSHPKFQYELGKKYTFEYRGENYITIAGNRKQKATIEGLAEFHYVSRCDGVLKLKNVRISQKLSEREMQELVRELAIPVSYSYEDGKIERVCPSPKDSKHSLNIKKGVLSAIINTMSKLDTPQQVKEEDSLGKCLTKYTVKYNNGVEIQKVKDLKSCTNRHSSVTSLITKPYDSPNSRIHTLPVFPEEHLVCKQWVKDKFIQKVECTEHAKIKPMKNRESVIEFDGTIELKYLSHSPSDLEQIEASNGPESILYNLEEHSDMKTREEEVKSILREMCSKNNGVMDITVSKDFIKLVSLVKTLPYNTLEEIHNSLKDGQLCSSKKVRDLFIDTLPMAGTDSTIKLLVQLIEKKEITGLKAKLWPASLALIPKPTRKTISAIKPLLMMVDSAPILLGVSAMLHRFCASENCQSVPEVKEIISQLNSHLGRRCSSKQDEMVFSILKAFGNIGYLGEAEETIIACAKSNQKSLRLRLAAVDAFRRVNEKRPEQLLAIYLDSSENFELRISVLSSALKHADDMQLRKIKQAIENERNTQVSAYASTLISNMKKSSTPHKKNVKKLLQEIEVNPPKVNYWENSKNIEFSAHNEALNVGGSVESDVIHDSESKIPQALYSRFDLDLFDRSINLMEFGVRAEGLEELVRKLIGLKQENKMQELNLFTAKNILTDSKADLSLFFRTMNVELFDVSASDITALGEVIKIAEMMTKLSHERKADFSHSFLFLNSQLVIPSVTGRSYSLGLSGSATVALTASTKLNLLSFPRNADAKAHFQPSVNVEVSTTVGIQSNKQRPDLKLVSRMHMESSMEAEFKITEGHVALAKLSMPSENIAMAKFSSDVFEIQADHSEKRVFETMQKKIDYCMDKLEKPLGLSVCARWEVPKPFVIKSFPFIQGVGEVEVAVKKTDSSFSSYELSLEIPNRQSPQMKFQASLDTPGSTVNRRFAVEMDVKEKSRYHKELSMEITSPFRSAGGKGALIKKSDLIEGSLELHSESTQLFAINASTAISASRTKTSYKPTLEVSVLGGHPLKVGGSVSMSKGRKQQISIDIKANKPSSKPLAIKGTILKEGKIEMSMRSDWKVSSDLQVVTPLLSSQVRGSLEKKSGPLNKLSTSLSVDYEFRNMQKESVKLTALTQKSSSKVNTNARFQSTQFPSFNWEANWDMQGELQENLKNDITIKYGRNPERNHITLKHTSRMPSLMNGECSLSVMVPQLNIDSELKVSHLIEKGETPKLKWAADLRYKNDKHIKGLLDFDYSSKQPLKATTRAELELPSGTYSYIDHIEETEPRHFTGKSRLQYKEKYAELEYRVKQAEQHQSGHHYEVEGSLKTSYSSTPMKTKLAFHQEGSRLGIEGQLSVRRNSEYSIEAQLTKSGTSHLSVKSPQGEGNWKINNEPLRKSAEWDMKLKDRRSRRVAGSIAMDLESEKKFSFEIMPDADRHPEQKIAASSSVSIQGDSFNSHAKLQVNDIISVSITESGDASSWKMYECGVEASSKHFEPTEIQYKHDLSDSHGKSSVTVTKNGVPKVRAEIEGSTALNRNQRECSVRAALESLDNSFESKEFSMRHGLSNSGTYKTLKSEVKYHHSPRKVYKAEFNSDIQLEGMEMNAVVNTPLKNFEQQSLGVSFKKSDDSISSSVSISIPNNKVISLSSDIETKNRGITATWKAKTPFDIVRDVKVHLSLENQRSKKAIFSFIDVNSARIADVEANMISQSGSLDLDGQLKISPIPNVSFQGASFSYHHSRSAQSVSGKINLANSKQLSWSSEIKEEGSGISTTTSISTPFNKVKSAKVHLSIEHDSSKKSLLSYVDVNEERKGDVEVKIISSSQKLEVQGRLKTSKTPEISAHLNIERSHGALSANAKVLKGTSPLWSTVVSKQSSENGDQLSIKAESFEKTLVDLQVSSDMSSEEMKLSVKASGKFSPVSLSISSDLSDRKHAKMQIMLCKESSSNKCYTLKAHHKNQKNSRNHHHLYRQVMVELERSSKSSDPEPLGSLEFLLASSEHEYNSKILLKMQEKNLGYEVKVHRRHHENEPCSMEMQMYMPERTSTLSAHVLHSSRNMQWDMELVPSTSAPEKKLSIEVKRETSNNQVSGHIKIYRPDMSKPIMIKGQLEKRGLIPVKGKVEMHYSPSSWFKVLTLEIMPEEDRSGKKSIMYRLYREDESVDMSMKLMKQQSRHEDMYGYHWSIKSDRMTKKGGVSVTVQKTRNGKPETIQIAYYAPNADIKIEGKSIWSEMVSDSGIVVMSRGRKIKEIRVRTKDSCLYFEVERSGPFFRSSLCLNKREGRNLQLVSLDARCRSKQCLNVKVAVDPNSSNFVDVTMEWKKEELRRSLNEITGLSNILRGDMLRKMKHELKEKIQRIVHEELKPTWRMVMRKYSEIRGKYMQVLKNFLRKHSEDVKESMKKIESLKQSIMKNIEDIVPWNFIETEILKPLRATIWCLTEGFLKTVMTHIPDMINIVWDSLKSQFALCFKKFCNNGSFCYTFRKNYERYGLRYVKHELQKKAEQTKASMQEAMSTLFPKFLSPWRLLRIVVKSSFWAVRKLVGTIIYNFLRPYRMIYNIVHFFIDTLNEVFGKFFAKIILHRVMDWGRKIEEVIRHRAIDLIDYVIHKFNDIVIHAKKDEDVRTAISLVKDAKKKAIRSWRSRDDLAKQAWEPVEASVKDNLKKLLKERFELTQYEPSEGMIKFRVRNPFGRAQLQIIKNEILSLKRKFMQWMQH